MKYGYHLLLSVASGIVVGSALAISSTSQSFAAEPDELRDLQSTSTVSMDKEWVEFVRQMNQVTGPKWEISPATHDSTITLKRKATTEREGIGESDDFAFTGATRADGGELFVFERASDLRLMYQFVSDATWREVGGNENLEVRQDFIVLPGQMEPTAVLVQVDDGWTPALPMPMSLSARVLAGLVAEPAADAGTTLRLRSIMLSPEGEVLAMSSGGPDVVEEDCELFVKFNPDGSQEFSCTTQWVCPENESCGLRVSTDPEGVTTIKCDCRGVTIG